MLKLYQSGKIHAGLISLIKNVNSIRNKHAASAQKKPYKGIALDILRQVMSYYREQTKDGELWWLWEVVMLKHIILESCQNKINKYR